MERTIEEIQQFEGRKKDHIRLSLDPRNEATGQNGLSRIRLQHEALPELDFSEVSVQRSIFSKPNQTPLLVSSMTAGHVDSINLNARIAKACEKQGWLMGVGSQRRELFDSQASREWIEIKEIAPQVKLIGNIGLSQLITTETAKIKTLLETMEAEAIFVHTNPLQECLQNEGTPYFKGGIESLTRLCNELDMPVILKETGCGFSKSSLQRLSETGLYAVDVSGLGGTHWGRIEGHRVPTKSVKKQAANTFANWGESTAQSMINAKQLNCPFKLWASGGVRTGLDVAKLIAMGAEVVGLAKPILEAALVSEESLLHIMDTVEYELKIAMFCTGSKTLGDLGAKVEYD